MKKILKIFLALALVTVLAVAAVSCGRVRSGKDLTDAEKLKEYSVYGKVNEIDLGDFSPVKEVGEYLLLHKNEPEEEKPNVYALYDVVNGKMVGDEARTLTPISPFTTYLIDGKTLIIDTSKSTESKAIVYYEGHSVTVSGDLSIRTSYFPGGALVSVGKYVFYKNGDGNLTYTTNSNLNVSEIVGGANGYYFSFDSEYILVFDSAFNLYGRVVVPSYAVEKTVFALSNGNILVQYCYRADEYSDDYDYMDETGSKFIIKTLIYEAEKNDDREIKFEYKCSSPVMMDMLSDKVTNLITVYKIKDRRIDLSESEKLTVALSDAGRVLTTFEKASVLLNSAVILPKVGGFYTGTSVEGKVMLFDEKLNVMGTFDSLRNFTWGYLGDDVVYDLDGREIMNIEKEDYSVLSVKNDCIILTKSTTEQKIYQGETLPTLITTTDYYYLKGEEWEKIASYTNDKDAEITSAVKGDIEWSDIGSFMVTETDEKTDRICGITVYAADGLELLTKSVDVTEENGDVITSVAVIPLNKTNRSLVTLKFNEWNSELNGYEQKTVHYLLKNA